jgi:hypothetical protein
MADNPSQPIPLNKGLDLVTPPLMIEPGAIIDCLNYEMTDIAGYKRVDGFESYDGYPNGAIYSFYRIRLVATNPADQSLLVPGVTIRRAGPDGVGFVDIGVVVGGPFNTDYYDVVPRDSTDTFVVTESLLMLADGTSNLILQSELGVLKIHGEAGGLGSSFTFVTSSGASYPMTVNSTPIEGRSIAATPTDYLTSLRTYSAVLRALVQNAPAQIAGLYWYTDRLLAAVNTLGVTLSILAVNPTPLIGTRMRWNGLIYRLIRLEQITSGTTNTYRAHLYPIGTSGTVNDNLIEVNYADTAVTTWLTGVVANGDPSSDGSSTAALGYFNNPSTSTTRGFTYLNSGSDFSYNSGTYVGNDLPITMDSNAVPSDTYYVVGDAGATVLKARLQAANVDSGTFPAGTAVGTAQIVVYDRVSGTRDYLKTGDQIHNAYPTTGSSQVMTVNSIPTMAYLAGTGAIRAANTRYLWGTFNFYGNSSTLSAYGVNGAGKAFQANAYGYGLISTGTPIDQPKYLAFHANKLALGFAHGSIQLSVNGNPHDYSGLNGAIEVTTGDDVTGLLEISGDSLAIFGRRSVRRITGTTDADMNLSTISANTGCFNYSAVVVGANAVYTNVNGITTLEQTAAYGDFQGSRVSDPISNWLRPKLIGMGTGFETGGVAMAYPVRGKSQYRLVLLTGEVVVVTFTKEGPRITFSNYGLTGQTRVPLAWSSETAVQGQEHVHVVWDADDWASTAIELESGWGFNGVTFTNFFDLAHIFPTNAAYNAGIPGARLFGQGYGVATLDLKSAGIENDFEQEFHSAVQDISLPVNPVFLYDRMRPVTNIIDQANWGLGIKLRVQGTYPENTSNTEPTHICQVLVLNLRSEGAKDA